MTPEEQQALEDRDWWRDFGAQFGWRLYGFTYRNGATFFTSDQGRIEITGDQKEAIAAALREAVETERRACAEVARTRIGDDAGWHPAARNAAIAIAAAIEARKPD